MRRSPRSLLVRTAMALLVVTSLALSSLPAAAGEGMAAAKKKRFFKGTGHVLLPNVPITWYEFTLESCPSMPQTQGLTGFVFELPNVVLENMGATATISPGPAVGSPSLVFFGPGCESLGTDLSPALVPHGTRYIEVHEYFAANYDVTLTVDRIRRPRL